MKRARWPLYGAHDQHSEKTWQMMVNPGVDGYTETLNTPKHAKAITYWKPKNIKNENIS